MKSSRSHEAMHKRLGNYSWVMVRKRLRRKPAFYFTNDSMTHNKTLNQFRDATLSVKPSHWIVCQLSYQGSPTWETVHEKDPEIQHRERAGAQVPSLCSMKIHAMEGERGGGVSGEAASKKPENSTVGSCRQWLAQSWNLQEWCSGVSSMLSPFVTHPLRLPCLMRCLPASQPDITTLFQRLAKCQLLIEPEQGVGMLVVE